MNTQLKINYQATIGLEIHLQLSTESKVFCSCSTKFGAKPNTQVCPVCLGFPGVLPVLNKKALEYAIKASLALNCEISSYIRFDRKNYYYPDLPKNYQISQYRLPIGRNGFLMLGDRKIRIRRVHLEEDAGKLIHSEDGKFSFVDYNRTGVPLLEIVTEPDIKSPQETFDFLNELKTTLRYLGISDCNMEEGSLRCDCNISLKNSGDRKLGVKTELKNMNSFHGVKQALEYEIKRQASILEKGEKVIQETRLWDIKKQKTYGMRTKEEVHDYRYFPEPDLVPYEISSELIGKIKASIPELPSQRRERFIEDFNLSEYDASILVKEKEVANYFEEAVKFYPHPKKICNWLMSELFGILNELKIEFRKLNVSAEEFAFLLKLIDEGKISARIAKDILPVMVKEGKSVSSIIEEKELIQITDGEKIQQIVLEVIDESKRAVKDYLEGKEKAIAFLVGKVMQKTKGKANPQLASKILKEKLQKLTI
jgi:aspartyl-tRNA(Asn)/glutamyl-tRNA(Gln) amidotransferase subunit B